MIASMILPLAIRRLMVVADADEPGMRAGGEAHRTFTSQSRNVRVVRAIGAKDPAELVGKAA
jgi:DNA primase